MPRSKTKPHWTLNLPRFHCPHCDKWIDNIQFKGRIFLPVPITKGKKGKGTI